MTRLIRAALVVGVLVQGAVASASAPVMTATYHMQDTNNVAMIDQLRKVEEMTGKAKDILQIAAKQILPAHCAAGVKLIDPGTSFSTLGLPADCLAIMALVRGNVKQNTLDELMKAMPLETQNTLKAIQATTKLYQSVGGLKTDLEARSVEAATAKLSWSDYVKREADRVAQGNQRAKDRLEQERAMFMAVEADHRTAQKLIAELPNTIGVQQQMQIANVNMNRLLQQGARINQLMAQAQGSDKAVEEADRAAQRDRAMRQAGQFNQRNAARDQETYSGINRIDGGGSANWSQFSNYKKN